VTCTGDCEEANAANAEQNCGALPQRKLQVVMDAGRPADGWTGSAPRHASPEQRTYLKAMTRGFFEKREKRPEEPFGEDDYTSMYRMKVFALGYNKNNNNTSFLFNIVLTMCSLFSDHVFFIQSISGHSFGTELKGLCELFRLESDVVTPSVRRVARYSVSDSSVQGTIPLTSIPTLDIILRDGARGLCDAFTHDRRQLLRTTAGLPVLATLLDDIASKVRGVTEESRASRYCPVLRDCDAVLTYVKYLCDIVVMSYRQDIRARLLAEFEVEGWRRAEVQEPDPGLGSNVHSDVGSEEHEPSVRAYDAELFHRCGIHMPCLRKHRERGVYAKDSASQSALESSCAEGGCDKEFSVKSKKTSISL
jgi:hypothetical protein